MLDLKFIRENPEIVRKALEEKGGTLNLDELLTLDKQVLDLKRQTEALQAERNANAKAAGKSKPEERAALIEKGKAIGDQLAELEPQLRELDLKLKNLLYLTPTIPWEGAPVGPDDSFNVETRVHGTPHTFLFEPLDHVALIEKNGWGDFERAAKVSGSRSYILKGDLAILRTSPAALRGRPHGGGGFHPHERPLTHQGRRAVRARAVPHRTRPSVFRQQR